MICVPNHTFFYSSIGQDMLRYAERFGREDNTIVRLTSKKGIRRAEYRAIESTDERRSEAENGKTTSEVAAPFPQATSARFRGYRTRFTMVYPRPDGGEGIFLRRRHTQNIVVLRKERYYIWRYMNNHTKSARIVGQKANFWQGLDKRPTNIVIWK